MLSENVNLLMEILEGKLPSKIFNRVLEAEPSMDKYELADVFLARFDRLVKRGQIYLI